MTARCIQRNPRWAWLTAATAFLWADQARPPYFSTSLVPGDTVRVTKWLDIAHLLYKSAPGQLSP